MDIRDINETNRRFNNKITLEITTSGFSIPNDQPPKVFLALSSVSYGLGFREVYEFKNTVFTVDFNDEAINKEIVISEELNNHIILIDYVDAPSYELKTISFTIPSATYDIYTLINVLKKNNLLLEYDPDLDRVRAIYLNNDGIDIPFNGVLHIYTYQQTNLNMLLYQV